MKYYTRKQRVFGIRHGGNVEIPILKFLYNRREYDECYYVKTIADAIGICDENSARNALNRLHDRMYVKKIISRQDARYTVWRIRRNANVYREVEKRIGIYKRPKIFEHHEEKDYNEKDSSEDYIDKISTTTVKLSPLKITLQSMFPYGAVPLEIGYQILSNLNTVRNMYNLTTATRSYEFKNSLNETVKDATKLVYPHIAGFIAQPIKDKIIPNIVETSSKYLEEKEIFKDITKYLNLDESYSDDFKDFYKASISNCLKDKFNEYISPK